MGQETTDLYYNVIIELLVSGQGTQITFGMELKFALKSIPNKRYEIRILELEHGYQKVWLQNLFVYNLFSV